MRVLFTGGGTAGHINPALAVAGYLREQEPDTKILYVGNRGGMEERLVTVLAIREALLELEEEERELILLRYVNEVPVDVIGKIYGISRFSVYRRTKEALKCLREKLGEEDFV